MGDRTRRRGDLEIDGQFEGVRVIGDNQGPDNQDMRERDKKTGKSKRTVSSLVLSLAAILPLGRLRYHRAPASSFPLAGRTQA